MPLIKNAHASTLGIHIRNEVLAQIKVRGESIGKKKGGYAALILDWWFKQGCPAVNDTDRAVQAMKDKKSA